MGKDVSASPVKNLAEPATLDQLVPFEVIKQIEQLKHAGCNKAIINNIFIGDINVTGEHIALGESMSIQNVESFNPELAQLLQELLEIPTLHNKVNELIKMIIETQRLSGEQKRAKWKEVVGFVADLATIATACGPAVIKTITKLVGILNSMM